MTSNYYSPNFPNGVTGTFIDGSGFTITVVRGVITDFGTSTGSDALLLESGGYILLETGGKILLE